MVETSLLAVFLIGLLGGVHCAGMCGGIVSALSMRSRIEGRVVEQVVAVDSLHLMASSVTAGGTGLTRLPGNPGRSVSLVQDLFLYNLGRIGMYTLLGALAGGIGSVGWLLQTALPVQQVAFAMTNVLLVLMGLYVAGLRSVARLLERLGQPVWAVIKPHATQRLRGHGVFNSMAAGSLWGLVPCGMVYGVLMASLVAGGAQKGALLMLVFGLGTLPNLVLLGLSGNWLARASRQPWVRRMAGSIIALFGLVGLLRLEAAQSIPLVRELCQHLPSAN